VFFRIKGLADGLSDESDEHQKKDEYEKSGGNKPRRGG
jgi:hypothetical protein